MSVSIKIKIDKNNISNIKNNNNNNKTKVNCRLQQQFGLQAIQPLHESQAAAIEFPILEYPVKVSSFNLDKTPVVEGVLMGIKGQYLILDTGVINIRTYTGYQVEFYSE